MNLIAEASLLLMAAEYLSLPRKDIVRWADSKIACIDNPPDWLIDLSVLSSDRQEDYYSLLRQVARPSELNAESQIAVVLDAYGSGVRSLPDTLSGLWKIWSGSDNRYEAEDFPDSFADILVHWDCIDYPLPVPSELVRRCDEEFVHYRTEHSGTMSAVGEFLRKIKNGQQAGRVDGDQPPN